MRDLSRFVEELRERSEERIVLRERTTPARILRSLLDGSAQPTCIADPGPTHDDRPGASIGGAPESVYAAGPWRCRWSKIYMSSCPSGPCDRRVIVATWREEDGAATYEAIRWPSEVTAPVARVPPVAVSP